MLNNTFVILGHDNDYGRMLDSHILKQNKRILYCDIPAHRFHGLLWFLYKSHTSEKVNKHFTIPFQSLWARVFLSKSIRATLQQQENIVFLLSGALYKYETIQLFSYLREHYNNCKIVYTLNDRVALYQSRKPFFTAKLKKYFDLVITYNNKDAKEYSFPCTPPRLYDYSWVVPSSNLAPTDVFFVGRVKGRLEILLRIFEQCEQAGLKCDFHIVGVSEEEQKYPDKIQYNGWMSYTEVLQRSLNSKAILNIIQDGASGITLRDYEAIGMNKCLITNNKDIENHDFYSEVKVIFIENIEHEIHKVHNTKANWNKTDKYSVENYYKWLEQELEKNI